MHIETGDVKDFTTVEEFKKALREDKTCELMPITSELTPEQKANRKIELDDSPAGKERAMYTSMTQNQRRNLRRKLLKKR